jgi:hypothetical protein
MSCSPEGDNPLVWAPPRPYDCIEFAIYHGYRNKAVLVVPMHRDGMDRAPIEKPYGVLEVQFPIGEHAQPFCFIPFEHALCRQIARTNNEGAETDSLASHRSIC